MGDTLIHSIDCRNQWSLFPHVSLSSQNSLEGSAGVGVRHLAHVEGSVLVGEGQDDAVSDVGEGKVPHHPSDVPDEASVARLVVNDAHHSTGLLGSCRWGGQECQS